MEPRTREYQFAGFELSVRRRRLHSPEGRLVDLPARAFDALVFLVEHRFEEISKEQILKGVWPDTIVEENNLNQAIFSLRRALGDSAADARYILTLPGRGYRFVADVTEIVDSPEAAPPSPPRWRPAAIAGGVLAIAAALSWAFWPDPTARVPASVAVLPFKSLLKDQSNPALEQGMTNSLIAQLSAITGLRVTSLSAVQRVGGERDPLAAGKSLSVDAVVEGYVLREGERLRITTRLLRVTDGQSLWSGNFDEKFSDILAVQDSISQRVAQTIAPHLSQGTAHRKRAGGTENAEAYQLYTEGFYNQQRRDKDGLPEAVKYYEAALMLDPGYVDAWGNLSRTLAVQGVFGTRPGMEVFPRAKEAALKALQLDPESSGAHAAYAHELAVYERDYKLADEHYNIAKRLDPTVPELYLLSSINKAHLGRLDQGLAEIRRALDIEPASLLFRTVLGILLYYNRSYDQAERELRRVVQLQPQSGLAQVMLGKILAVRGDYGGALQHFPRSGARTGVGSSEPGRTFALMGRKPEALAEIATLRERVAAGFGANYEIATIYVALGDNRLACDALRAALADQISYVGNLQIDPAMDPLRTDPCFAEAVHHLYADPHR